MTHPERIKLAEEHERFAQVLRQPDGTVIESQGKGDNQPSNWETILVEDCAFKPEYEVRLKPEPKYRPMTEEDFVGIATPIWFVYGCPETASKFEVCLFDSSGLKATGYDYCKWGFLFSNDWFQYSIDGRKTWHRFRVEVTE